MADRPPHLRSRALFYAAALLWLPVGVVATAVVRFGPTAVVPGEWPTAIAMAASSLIVAAVCGLPLAFACRRLGRIGHPRAAWIAGVILGAATVAASLPAGLFGPPGIAVIGPAAEPAGLDRGASGWAGEARSRADAGRPASGRAGSPSIGWPSATRPSHRGASNCGAPMETRPGAALRPYFPLVAGVLINLSIGILYAWSVFVAPLEAELGADRATVSGAQSLCLFTATIGCFVMHRLLHWFTLPQLTLVTGAVTAAGLALVGFGQSVAGLYVGYGVLYGFAAGILYFIAMTAASIDGPVRPSIAMSINMSAVAAGGIAWAPGLTVVIDAVGPATAFGMAAAVVLAATAIGAALIASSRKEPPATGAIGLFQDMLTDRPRVVIAIFLGFFCVAFTALVVIGHAATMMAAWGASAGETQFAPMLNSAGYVAGALVGGLLTDLLTGRRVLTGVGLVMGVFLLGLYFAPGVVMGLAAIAAVGVAFGVLASAHPVTVAGYYGTAALPRVFGRIALAYGLGGLLGPFSAGALYDADQHYGTAVILIAVLAFVGAAFYAGLPHQERLGASARRAA